MKHIIILVEGQTEDAFVKNFLAPYFQEFNIYCSSVIVATSHLKSGKKFKGGISTFDKVRNDLLNLLKNKHALVTTMFDFYGLPADFPEYAEAKKQKNYLKVARKLETAFSENISNSKFLPYIQMHEFETLLFSSRDGFQQFLKINSAKKKEFDAIFKQFKNPEEINNNRQTAPSKRIQSAFPNYQKVKYGMLISEYITLPVMLEKCPHFGEWIEKLRNLNK